jgi:hypothetical protein
MTIIAKTTIIDENDIFSDEDIKLTAFFRGLYMQHF